MTDIVYRKIACCVVRSEGKLLLIGRDFVDAATIGANEQSHGIITLQNHEDSIPWRSTLDCVASEAALRQLAAQEGKRVTGLISHGGKHIERLCSICRRTHGNETIHACE